MKHIDFTIHTQNETVALIKGDPAEHGLDGTKYIFLTDDFIEARIWLIGLVTDTEKQRIVQGVMSYLETTLNTVDRAHELTLTH